jgi:hypothetical protein
VVDWKCRKVDTTSSDKDGLPKTRLYAKGMYPPRHALIVHYNPITGNVLCTEEIEPEELTPSLRLHEYAAAL